MELFSRLLGTTKVVNGLKLVFDKGEQHWTVKRSGQVVYLGTKEQCEKYLQFQA